MAEQPNISQILAALCESYETPTYQDIHGLPVATAQRPSATPPQPQHPLPQPPPQQHAVHSHPPPGYPPISYPPSYPPAGPPVAAVSYNIPQPISSGSIDISNIKPINSGSVAIQDAVARARGIAAEKGIGHWTMRGNGSRLIWMATIIHSLGTDADVYQHLAATTTPDWLAAITNALAHARGLQLD